MAKVNDLEGRTYRFAKDVFALSEIVPKTISNIETLKQVVRSVGSVAANYIEANEALGKKDFQMKLPTARGEAKESRFWLRLSKCSDHEIPEQVRLIQESTELMLILSAILNKSL